MLNLPPNLFSLINKFGFEERLNPAAATAAETATAAARQREGSEERLSPAAATAAETATAAKTATAAESVTAAARQREIGFEERLNPGSEERLGPEPKV